MNLQETPVLSVRGLTVRYGTGCPHCQDRLEKNRCPLCGTVWAANDISLDVYPGEVLGIVGESGSGKSTLRHGSRCRTLCHHLADNEEDQ